MNPHGPVTPTEIPVRFRAGREELFGILTAPTAPPRELGVILLNGGACTPSPGRNQFSVRMARRLATSGLHVLRFDYHGVGESTGRVVRYSLNRPFTADLLGAVDVLRRAGLAGWVFIGRCFGARTALSALEHVGGVRGIASISMPLHDFMHEEGEGHRALGISRRIWPAMLDGRRRRWVLRAGYFAGRRMLRRLRLDGGHGPDWVSEDVLGWLRLAVARRIPLLFLYGADEHHFREFTEATRGAVGTLLGKAAGLASVWTTPGAVHDLTSVSVQEAIIARVTQWAQAEVLTS